MGFSARFFSNRTSLVTAGGARLSRSASNDPVRTRFISRAPLWQSGVLRLRQPRSTR